MVYRRVPAESRFPTLVLHSSPSEELGYRGLDLLQQNLRDPSVCPSCVPKFMVPRHAVLCSSRSPRRHCRSVVQLEKPPVYGDCCRAFKASRAEPVPARLAAVRGICAPAHTPEHRAGTRVRVVQTAESVNASRLMATP